MYHTNYEIKKTDGDYILTDIGLFEIGKYYNYQVKNIQLPYKRYHSFYSDNNAVDPWGNYVWNNRMHASYISPTDNRRYRTIYFAWETNEKQVKFKPCFDIKSKQYCQPTICKLLGVDNGIVKFEDYITGELLYTGELDNHIEIHMPDFFEYGMIPQIEESEIRYNLLDLYKTKIIYTEMLEYIKAKQNEKRTEEKQKIELEERKNLAEKTLSKEYSNFDSEIADVLIKNKIKKMF